jgi:hypothetical protein
VTVYSVGYKIRKSAGFAKDIVRWKAWAFQKKS